MAISHRVIVLRAGRNVFEAFTTLAALSQRAQVLLGHASLQMTADTYGHLLPAKGDEAAEFSEGEQALIG